MRIVHAVPESRDCGRSVGGARPPSIEEWHVTVIMCVIGHWLWTLKLSWQQYLLSVSPIQLIERVKFTGVLRIERVTSYCVGVRRGMSYSGRIKLRSSIKSGPTATPVGRKFATLFLASLMAVVMASWFGFLAWGIGTLAGGLLNWIKSFV